MTDDEEGLDIPYPRGHNWAGYTPRQISEAYKKLDERTHNKNDDKYFDKLK